MSEEDKQVIKDIKERVEEYENYDMATFFTKDVRKLFEIINKQQKEIELVTKTYDKALDTIVDKDNKIKAKIKELENKEFLYKEEKRFNEEEIKFNYAKRILQELLGEEDE